MECTNVVNIGSVFKEVIMKRKLSSAMSILMVLAMVFNSVLIPVAVYAEGTDATVTLHSAQSNTQEAESEMSNIKTELDGIGEVKGKGLLRSSTRKKIRNANVRLNEARSEVNAGTEDVREGNKAASGGGISGAIDKVAEKTLSGLAKAAAAAQTVLIKLGQLLQSIGKMLQTVGAALKAIGQILSAIPWTAAVGQALVNVGNLLTKIGCAVEASGVAIEAIGNGASKADQTFGDLLGTIIDATKKGWQVGEAINAKTDASTAVADTTSKIKEVGSSIGGAIKGLFKQDAGADL